MIKNLLKAVLIAGFFMLSQATFGQLAKCKGKYFGNIISGGVPSTYNTYWNQVTSENASKWGSVEGTMGQYNFSGSDVCFNWAKNNNGLFKYHNLIWGGQTPGWVSNSSTPASTITNNINPYFKAVADHYAPMGGLKLIDVLNEPVNTPMPGNLKAALTAGYRAEPANAGDLNNQYGWAIWCFQVARKYFPDATLLINEYNIEMNWNNCRAPYIAMVQAIKNAPNLTNGQKNLIDGVGLQCHGIDNLSAANFKACIDEIWSKTGVPIHITEFDQTANPNEAKQQAVYSSLIPVAWEHPHVAGITLWGYIQGSTWIGGNGQLGPNGTDSGIIYSGNYSANPFGARPAMTWLKQYMASQASLSCCPAPAPFASCTTTTCNPTAITPYIQVNGGTWQQASTVTINAGDQVVLGPQPLTGGSWAWTGCGTSGSAREQIITPTSTCTATATYTNSCGANSTQAFVLTVNSPNTPPTVSITSPLTNASFTAPASITITANAADANGTVSKVDFFNGTTLLGSDVTSPYSFTWSNVAAGTYTLTARATDNAGATTTSSTVTVTVTACSSTVITPYVQVNGGTWQQASTVTINAGDQVVLGPQPLTGGTWAWAGCGTTGSSREQTISPTATCIATATYTNACGAISTQAFTLTVNIPNTPPTVSISSPLTNATFTAPASITINANAADVNGTVSNVDFFNGTTLLGSDATSPYSFTWSNVAAGTYTLTARATDNAGASTTSSAVSVTVTASCSPTAIIPYVQVNGGAWQQTSTVTINSGDQLVLGPQPLTGGTWAWTGCGTTGSAREQIISPTGTCTATATYTNACGSTSTQAFTLTVNPNTSGTGVNTYMNPVIPGNHPDQTMIKVGNDFYTAGSSFHWTPNLPIYHSTDLVHWQEIAQVVSPTWSGLAGHDGPKGGTWEGALAYFANKYWAFFYIMGGGQYFSTTTDPKGPWTTPTIIQGSVGYDNSVFVDDDGRAYMLMKNGQSVNRIQELNSSGQLTGPVLNMDWVNANNRFSWAEGPVMCKRNGRYYYFVAGNVYGGQYVLSSSTLTATESSWTVHGNFFRGTASGSYTGPNHISAPVQIADGTWWCLAHSYSNNGWEGQGRQSMLFQVLWDANGVPYANNPTGTPLTAPNLGVSGNYEFPESDFFNSTSRKLEWFFQNTANVQKASLSARPGYLRLSPGSGTTHIMQREPAKQYSIVTKVDFSAAANGQQAGLRLMNGEDLVYANLYSGYNNGKKIGITFNGVTTEVNNTIGNTVWLKIVRSQHNITGYFGADGVSWTSIGGTISVAALDQAQTNDNAWVGTAIALYATSITADFDQFSFNHGLDPISVASYYNYSNVSISGGTVSNSADNGWCMLPGVTMESNGTSANQIVVNAASAVSTGTLEVWTDNIGTAGNRIAVIPITNTGGTGTYKDFTANVTVSGQHDLYLRFVGGTNVFRLNTVRFVTGTSNTSPTVSITSPANNASFTAPASITINANASDADGTVSNVQFFNGTTLLGSDATSPYSFSWTNVAAGTYTLTARATDNAGAMTTSSAVIVTVNNPVVVQAPFSGTPSPIPGKIEAENYDLGGAGVAFNETTSGNSGNVYRTDDVDIEATSDMGGGYNVGWIEAGEWLEYTVNVTASGIYNLEARVASANTGGSFHIEMDGVNISGSIAVPNTGAWQTFQSVSINNINLTAGQKVMRIAMDASWFNINYVAFTAACTPTAITPYVQINGGAWAQGSSATLDAGGSVTFGPQPVSGGSWSWTGPNGFTATTREIALSAIQASQAGNYVATYTNTNGCNSTQTFTVTLNSVMAAAASLPEASVSPNPAESAFNLTVLEPVETFKVVNSEGITVINGFAMNAGDTVSIGEQLSAGIYMIYIQYSDGRIETRKVQKL